MSSENYSFSLSKLIKRFLNFLSSEHREKPVEESSGSITTFKLSSCVQIGSWYPNLVIFLNPEQNSRPNSPRKNFPILKFSNSAQTIKKLDPPIFENSESFDSGIEIRQDLTSDSEDSDIGDMYESIEIKIIKISRKLTKWEKRNYAYAKLKGKSWTKLKSDKLGAKVDGKGEFLLVRTRQIEDADMRHEVKDYPVIFMSLFVDNPYKGKGKRSKAPRYQRTRGIRCRGRTSGYDGYPLRYFSWMISRSMHPVAN
ncbi:hypothetical protein KQX54_021682 [Cotesia glomerata]|uniref:Uncharacterized protein n=1 Tax=Cotesia glomerata TaxID=32391 RepID=A0AAV7IWP3_COTGL|nr:hypothetical protein KQX54_021682 [Cotesia glomerata]